MCGPGARSRLLYQLRFQGVHQQPEGLPWHRFRAGRHSRSPGRAVRAETRDLHMEPPEVGTAARPPTIRPRAQLKGARRRGPTRKVAAGDVRFKAVVTYESDSSHHIETRPASKAGEVMSRGLGPHVG